MSFSPGANLRPPVTATFLHDTPLSGYIAAVLATLLTCLVRWGLNPWLGDSAPLMLFMLPVMFAAWWGGLGPGMVAASLGALLGDFFFCKPTFSLWIEDPRDRLATGILLAVGFQISWLCESLHRARRHLQRRLEGLLPICAWCKRIRDDKSYWHQVETYLAARTDARFTHAMCPECLDRELTSLNGPGDGTSSCPHS